MIDVFYTSFFLRYNTHTHTHTRTHTHTHKEKKKKKKTRNSVVVDQALHKVKVSYRNRHRMR